MSNSNVTFGETNSHIRLLGLIGAMRDGIVSSFEHDGVFVHREGESIGISPTGPPQDIRGGRQLLASGNIEETANWVEAKADYYGGQDD